MFHSDNEEDQTSRNGRQETLEFKDEEETVTTKSIQITQATETTTTTTRKRSGAPSSKTLDLGAAAHYTGDKSPEDKVEFSHWHLHIFKSEARVWLSPLLVPVVRESVVQRWYRWPVIDWPFTWSEQYSR